MMKKLTFLLMVSGITLSACNGGGTTPSSSLQTTENAAMASKSLVAAGKNSNPGKNTNVSNSGWSLFGNPAGSATGGNTPNFIIAKDGSKYLAYVDYQKDAVSVMKYDGSGWKYLGNQFITNKVNGKTFLADNFSGMHLAIDNNNVPYIVFGTALKSNPQVATEQINVMKFENGQWQTVTTQGLPAVGRQKNGKKNSDYGVGDFAVKFSADNTLYFTFKLGSFDQGVGTVNHGLQVFKLDNHGSEWQRVGSENDKVLKSISLMDTTSMQIDSNGKLYIADGAVFMKVITFNGSSWEYVGSKNVISANTDGVTSSGAWMGQLAIDSHDNLYMAYGVVDNYSDIWLQVKKFDGKKWVNLNAPKSLANVDINLEVDSADNIYVGFGNTAQGGIRGATPYVLKFDGKSWGYIGGQISTSQSNETIPHVDPITGQLYVSTNVVVNNSVVGFDIYSLNNNATLDPVTDAYDKNDSSSSSSSSSGSSTGGGSSATGGGTSGGSSSGSSSSSASASKYNAGGNANYVAGSKVIGTDGKTYECKPYPYSGWCNGSSSYYAPGSGIAWADAWTLVK